MKKRTLTISVSVMMTALLSLAVTTAFAAMTPELAAKRQNYERQKAQQITPEQRKAAAEGLKVERKKIYEAKMAAQKSNPGQNKK